MLQHFVDVYRRDLHLQPLALFCVDDLVDQLVSSAQFLRWAFLALMLTLSGHAFYSKNEIVARDFYAQSAETAVSKLASEGVSGSEVAQSLCVIALKHIRSE